MTMELETVVVGLLAGIAGDQILIMLLSAGLHLLGRKCCGTVRSHLMDMPGMTAPGDAMAPPRESLLVPVDAMPDTQEM